MRWKKKSTGRARQLRRRETAQEKLLWKFLRDGRMRGFKFRRQHPAGSYFFDFACVSLQLAIELDGAGHPLKGDHDAIRDGKLSEGGWLILRFWNHDVELRLSAVLETIDSEVRRLSPHPDPLP
jgi:very-short-patch-repair endonuclease